MAMRIGEPEEAGINAESEPIPIYARSTVKLGESRDEESMKAQHQGLKQWGSVQGSKQRTAQQYAVLGI